MLLPSERSTAEIVGLTLRRLRLALGMTQMDLARRCGITHQQLHKYEQSRNAVSTTRLVTLARALGMRPSAFVTEVEARLANPADASAPVVERQTLQLVANFERIGNDEVRRNIVRLVREVARAQPADTTDAPMPVTLADTPAPDE